MPASPTELTLRKWRKAGYQCAVVEKWNPHMKIRQDLFGFIDVLAVGNGETVAIQTTSKKNVSGRLRKIEALEIEKGVVSALQASGWRVVVEGWHKPGRLWECREEAVPDFSSQLALAG